MRYSHALWRQQPRPHTISAWPQLRLEVCPAPLTPALTPMSKNAIRTMFFRFVKSPSRPPKKKEGGVADEVDVADPGHLGHNLNTSMASYMSGTVVMSIITIKKPRQRPANGAYFSAFYFVLRQILTEDEMPPAIWSVHPRQSECSSPSFSEFGDGGGVSLILMRSASLIFHWQIPPCWRCRTIAGGGFGMPNSDGAKAIKWNTVFPMPVDTFLSGSRGASRQVSR